jgi:hypothetical protein
LLYYQPSHCCTEHQISLTFLSIMIGDSVEESKSIDPPQRNTERTENRDAARTESERCARRRRGCF